MPVMNSKKKAIWYGKKMYKQIIHFKKLRPEATILFIGPADMLYSKDGVTGSHPYLEIVIEELKRNVQEAGGIYWDMYAAMGGKNSMLVWQNHKPKLGSSDGIHFTKKGANTIARMLFETIDNEYNIYKLKERLKGLNNGI
jgi:lysophospholipase L1-like esterase